MWETIGAIVGFGIVMLLLWSLIFWPAWAVIEWGWSEWVLLVYLPEFLGIIALASYIETVEEDKKHE